MIGTFDGFDSVGMGIVAVAVIGTVAGPAVAGPSAATAGDSYSSSSGDSYSSSKKAAETVADAVAAGTRC